jgi:hypothetical protein
MTPLPRGKNLSMMASEDEGSRKQRKESNGTRKHGFFSEKGEKKWSSG